MKTRLYSILAAAAVITGCAKEVDLEVKNPVAPGKRLVTIEASIVQTKTNVTDEGIYSWENTEQIGVVETDGQTVIPFSVEDAGAGKFTGTLSDGKEPVFAVSPVSAVSDVSEYEGLVEYTITLGDIDDYVPGTTNAVMIGTKPTAGSGNTYSFEFRHAAALVKVPVVNIPAGTAKVKLTMDKPIAGVWEDLDSTNPVLNPSASGSTSVTLNLKDAITAVNTSANFYFPVPVNTYGSFQFEMLDASDNRLKGVKKAGLEIPLAVADLFITPTITLEKVKTQSYVKVTDGADLVDGDYLIVYESGSVAFDGSLETLDAASNTINVEISNNVIAATSKTNASKFIIESVEDGYTIKSASGYYIGRTATSNGFNSSKTEKYVNTISVNNGVITIESSGGPTLRYNKASDQNRFRYYASGQQAIALYKLANNTNWTLESIAITTPPAKVTYDAGETFNPAGMVVTAHYVDADDNTNTKDVVITDYNVNPDGPLTTEISSVTISYEGQTATQNITVNVATGWIETAIANITAGDIFVIVGNNNSNYAMSNDNGTSSAPAAVSVTVSNNKITSEVTDNIKWNISGNATDGYTFYPNGSTDTWLYCTNTNNGVRVGTGDAKHFTISGNGYLTTSETEEPRYIGVYSSSDWRCYTGESGNIANQVFKFYRLLDPRESAGMHWSTASTTATITNSGINFTAPTLTAGNASNITYKSTVEEVAKVNASGVIEIVTEGTTKIQAIFAGDANYRPATAEYTLTVTDERTFAITITQPAEGGTISASPSGSQKAGTEITLTAEPAEGFEFVEWNVYKTGDVNAKVTISGNAFEMPAYPVTVTASFDVETTEKTEQVLFHESFGNNPNSATAWKTSYSVKDGVITVYQDASETVTEAKVSKNTMGYGSNSSALVSTSGKAGTYVVGPLNVSNCEELVASNYYGMSSGSWATQSYMKCYYSVDGTSYTEVSNSETGKPSKSVSSNANYVIASYALPAEAISSTLYLKFEFYCYQVNNKNTQIGQAYFDEVKLIGKK